MSLRTMLSKENANEAIEILLKLAVKQINELNDKSRQCLYEEYKEWIENLEDKGEKQDAIII